MVLPLSHAYAIILIYLLPSLPLSPACNRQGERAMNSSTEPRIHLRTRLIGPHTLLILGPLRTETSLLCSEGSAAQPRGT